MTEPVAVPAAERDLGLEACRASHRRLVATLDRVDDVTISRPSRLPDWTVGHVLTHLARNAESFVRILEAAEDGRTAAQYPGGLSQRTGDIEGGSKRSAAAIVNDVRSTCARLDDAFASASARAWTGSGVLSTGAATPCSGLPARRIREVEIHHVDLGLGYEPDDWPVEFVTAELEGSLAALPGRIEDPSQRARLLAWVAGRLGTPGEIDLAPF